MSNEDRDSLQFQSLTLHRMPGIESSIKLNDLDFGVNVVHGPNAAGKTRVVRAFNLLLWPNRVDADRAKVSGEFRLGSTEWYVEYDMGVHRFQRDGSPAEPPALPPAERSDRYNLALHDLLQEDTRNRSFADFIVQELSGGYDLNQAAEELEFLERPSGRGKTTRRAETAVENLEELRDRARDREQAKRRLRDLERRQEEVQEARKREEYLEQLRKWNRAHQQYREQQMKLEQFPDNLETYTGTELDRLESLENKIEEYEEQKRTAQTTIEEARTRLGRLDYPYDNEVSAKLRELKAKRDQLKEYESQIEGLEADRTEQVARRHEIAESLGSEVPGDSLQDFGRTTLDELEELARTEESTRSRIESYETYRNLLVEEDESSDVDLRTIRRGSEILENWLASSSGERIPRELSNDAPRVFASVVIAGLSVLSGVYVHVYFYGLLVVPVLLHWWVRFRRSPEGERRSGESPERMAARREYERLDLDVEPEEWTLDSVRQRLEDLYERRAEARLLDIKKSEWERRKSDYRDVRSERESLGERLEKFKETYGFAPDDGRALFYLVTKLKKWQDADTKIKGIDEKLTDYRDRREKLRDELNHEFSRWELDPVEESPEARSRIQEMERRVEVFREANRELDLAQQQLERADEALPDLESEYDQLFEKFDLEPGDKGNFRSYAKQHEQYQSARENCQNAQAIRDREHDRLTEYDRYEVEHEEWEPEKIQREIEQARAEADAYDDLLEEITEVRTRIEEAKKSYEIEPARAEKQRALEALREQFIEDCESMIGTVLRKHVGSFEEGDRATPEVFTRARERLSTITAGRYRLRINRSTKTPSFRVIDTRSGEGKGLDQLSSGNRVQVLLAVRMAFVEVAEKQVQLPLYLDETLANADDEKAGSIIESTDELARDGRQIFYFTAQGDEVAKWQTTADAPNCIDLTEHVEHQAIGAVEIPGPVSRSESGAEVASADGCDHSQYGSKLDVPPLNPWEPVESVHLWYLVEDPDLLEELLSRGLERWGPFKTVTEVGEGDFLGANSDHELTKVQQLAEATDTFIKRWRQGRNRPVNRSILVETDAVSSNFIDEVAELLEENDGDPEAVLGSLRDGAVSGFRSNKMDELERFFRSNDYIDSRDPLGMAVIRNAMISHMDDRYLNSREKTVDRLLERIRDHRL